LTLAPDPETSNAGKAAAEASSRSVHSGAAEFPRRTRRLSCARRGNLARFSGFRKYHAAPRASADRAIPPTAFPRVFKVLVRDRLRAVPNIMGTQQSKFDTDGTCAAEGE
jgi:hypothetical protein